MSLSKMNQRSVETSFCSPSLFVSNELCRDPFFWLCSWLPFSSTPKAAPFPPLPESVLYSDGTEHLSQEHCCRNDYARQWGRWAWQSQLFHFMNDETMTQKRSSQDQSQVSSSLATQFTPHQSMCHSEEPRNGIYFARYTGVKNK